MTVKKNVGIIRQKNDEVDDVAITGDMLRMERMTTNAWWVCIYRGKKRTSFMLQSETRIDARLMDSSIKCRDDSK